MLLTWMADELRNAGLTVVEYDGWKTRSNSDPSRYHPVGLISHHTAGSSILTNYPSPPYWRDSSLATKCNLTIRPDGTVVVLNAGYAYDSGLGSPKILDAVRNDRPLPTLTGLTSTVNGNPWFVDIEVQHKGDGSPIHPPQYAALITANQVICQHMNWDPMTRLIGHREWAPDRKVDPRWDGNRNPMPAIRSHTAGQPLPPPSEVRMYPTLDLSNVTANPTTWIRSEIVGTLQGLLIARRYAPANTIVGDTVDNVAGPGTRAALGRFQTDHALTKDFIAGKNTWIALEAF